MKKITFLLMLLFCSTSFARTIDVTKHGVTAGKDATLQLHQLLKSIKGESDVTLFFPKGKYEFKPENAAERYHAVTNHDNSLRRIAFDLYGFNNITVDGNGSTFMFYGLLNPFVSDSSNGVTIKNLNIDFDTPFNQELTVVSVDKAAKTFTVEVDSKYEAKVVKNQLFFPNYGWVAELSRNVPYDPKTRLMCFDSGRYTIKSSAATIKKVGKNKFSIKGGVKELPPVGTIYVNTTKPPFRLAQAIHLIRTKDVVIENVNIYAAGGMGVIAERTENIELTKVNIAPRKDRIFSVAADATHFNGCKGLIKVTDCLFENMGDDAINVHGSYVDIIEYLGDNQFLCEIHHKQQCGLVFSEKGDVIEFISAKNVQPLFETTVTATEKLNDDRFIVTVSKMPAKLPEGPLTFENITWNPDVIMRNCVSRGNRARAALITTKGSALLENNHFCSEMHGILLEGDNKAWYESGSVKDVIIRNNVFENVGYAGGPSKAAFPLYASPMLTPQQNLGDKQYHINVKFVNNTLKGFNSRLVHARSVKNLLVEGNTIEKSDAYPEAKTEVAIELDFCKDVVIKGNTWKGFDYKPKMTSVGNTENVKVSKNKGADF